MQLSIANNYKMVTERVNITIVIEYEVAHRLSISNRSYRCRLSRHHRYRSCMSCCCPAAAAAAADSATAAAALAAAAERQCIGMSTQ